jgi:tetratricopeptide (TPR) repeat protein
MTMEKKKLPKESKSPKAPKKSKSQETPEESKPPSIPKTPKPKKPKPPSGDQIIVENQGERNVIAAGRNARATAFNFNIRDFKWQPVVIVLVVVGALLAVILWYVVPEQAKEMAGQFNVAVAEFTVQDANGKTLRGKDGTLLAAYVENQIGSQFTEIELNKNIPYEVWGPDQTGVVAGDTAEERSINAAALAKKIHAHVLIYGVIISDGNQSRFVPEFYVNHASFQDASEITGEHKIGTEVKLSLPFVDSIQAVENRGLAGRVNALDLITIGLAYYSVDDFENAAYYLEQAAAEDRWLEASGKEVAYLLVGNAYVRWASRVDDSKYLTDAAENYAKALDINKTYGRGLVGQANVLYLEALGPLDHPQIDPAKLDEADARVTQALELEGQPESDNIESKAHFNRGQIDLARFSAKVPGEDWLVRAKEEFLFVTRDYESGDTTLESLASHSYFRLGIIAYYQGDPDSSISLIQKAIPMASPFSQGEFSAMLGDIYANLGRKDDAAKAYEEAISIAVSLGDEKSAQKYQDKLNGLK